MTSLGMAARRLLSRIYSMIMSSSRFENCLALISMNHECALHHLTLAASLIGSGDV